jgi:predicted transcriptional regulator
MVTRRNKLNDNQIKLLKLLYKFRFVTAELVAEHKAIRRSAVNNSFSILLDQELIARRYDNSYKLQGKGATYYLTPKAVRLLRDSYKLNETTSRTMLKNKRLSEVFVKHNLTIMAAYLNLRGTYPDIFNVFSKSELGDLDYFPEPKPDLYLSRKKPGGNAHNEYMLDIFSDNRLFIIKKRIDVYIDHYDSGDWGEEEYPTILLVCPDSRTEQRTQKYVESLLEDFDLLTTTKDALLNKHTKETAIWTDVFNPEELIGLA